MQPVSPYARTVILDDFAQAVASGKLDAVTLNGPSVTLEIENLDGRPQTIQRPDELIRYDKKALNWRAEKEQKAARTLMLHTGNIGGEYQQLLGDEGRFNELLTLRREYSRQRAPAKTSPVATKTATPKSKKTRKPTQ